MKTTVSSLLAEHRAIPEAPAIVAGALGIPTTTILTHPERTISWIEYWRVRYFFRRFRAGTPLAYLTGHKEFYGLDFTVNTHTLIPRPDTETMIDEIRSLIKTFPRTTTERLTFVDIGTGSGCIAITLAAIFKKLQPLVFATDISRSALRVAKRNAQKNNTAVTFMQGNLLHPLFAHQKFLSALATSTHLIITANLPYLTGAQCQNEPSIQAEPRSALVADNENGLSLYGQLFATLRRSGWQNQLPVSLYIEIDPRQSEGIQKLLHGILPMYRYEIKKDSAGHDRIIHITLSSTSTPPNQSEAILQSK